MKRMLVGTLLTSTLPALLTCALAPKILELWLHDPNVVKLGTTPLQFLLLAMALNSLYGCIYQVIIAKGQAHRVLQFNMISLLAASLTILLQGPEREIALGGTIWIAITFTQLFLGTIWFVKSQR
jgi:O-antigen/teichoic acid export membrane protein